MAPELLIDEVYEARRQADIVDDGIQVARRNHFADVIFDLSEGLQRILDAGAGGQAGMQLHLSGIHRGEEVGTQERHQQERYRDKDQEAGDEQPPPDHRQRQKVAVALADMGKAALKVLLESNQDVTVRAVMRPADGMRLEQIHRHGRHQGARQDERSDHGEHHAHRHRHEQEPRHALQGEHRHKDDADAEQRHESRLHDLARAVHDRGDDVLAMFQVPVDVLDRDGGVIHQNAHRQRQPAQCHDIQCLAHRPQPRQRRQHSQWDGDGDDHRGTPAAQEQ